MASRACKVKLRKPIGINNFEGKSFRCFARGDTLPFYFEFTLVDGTPVDITGWKCFVAFSTNLSCERPGCSDSALVLEVEIPVYDAAAGVFAGNVTNDHTKNIPCGLVYATIKYVTPPHDVGIPELEQKGLSYILDMCQLEVYASVAPST